MKNYAHMAKRWGSSIKLLLLCSCPLCTKVPLHALSPYFQGGIWINIHGRVETKILFPFSRNVYNWAKFSWIFLSQKFAKHFRFRTNICVNHQKRHTFEKKSALSFTVKKMFAIISQKKIFSQQSANIFFLNILCPPNIVSKRSTCFTWPWQILPFLEIFVLFLTVSAKMRKRKISFQILSIASN